MDNRDLVEEIANRLDERITYLTGEIKEDLQKLHKEARNTRAELERKDKRLTETETDVSWIKKAILGLGGSVLSGIIYWVTRTFGP